MTRTLRTLRLIEKQVRIFKVPSVSEISLRKGPYQILISCILSLRTQDKTTTQASKRLFALASNPYQMVKLSVLRLQKLIYPVGFYRNKAKTILEISKKIIRDYAGRVPNNIDGLLAFKGVGRKTANLVLGLGYNIPAICVDTHVHRISNRIGWVETKTPEQAEEALKRIIPKKYWIKLNTILVAFGQNICVPVSPYCSKCHIGKVCQKRGVEKSR